MTREALLAAASAAETDAVPMPAVIAVFAHPDDETVGLGARLGRLRHAHLIHVTDGAPRNEEDSRAHGFGSLAEYRAAREQELHCALEEAGIGQVSRECLGIPDQEAAAHLHDLTRTLAQQLTARRPEIILTHPYEGGHPDHDACAFAVHQAVAMSSPPAPLILECAFYHAGPDGIETGCFLSRRAREAAEIVCRLSPEEADRKRRLFACFPSQAATLQYFSTERELFRIAPGYNFTRPPHPGATFYDGFPWGMRSGRFCHLAAEAERALDRAEPRIL